MKDLTKKNWILKSFDLRKVHKGSVENVLKNTTKPKGYEKGFNLIWRLLTFG